MTPAWLFLLNDPHLFSRKHSNILGMSANPNTANPVLLPRATLAFSEWRTALILCLYCREQMSSSLHGPVKHPLTRVEVKEVTCHVSKHSCGRWCEALAWQQISRKKCFHEFSFPLSSTIRLLFISWNLFWNIFSINSVYDNLR